MRKNILNKESLKMRTFFVFIFLLAILFIFKANKVDAVGLNVGRDTLILGTGQNLFYGVMSGTSNAGASALLLEKPAGTALLRVTANGNVGIGTTNPTSKLTIGSQPMSSTIPVIDLSVDTSTQKSGKLLRIAASSGGSLEFSSGASAGFLPSIRFESGINGLGGFFTAVTPSDSKYPGGIGVFSIDARLAGGPLSNATLFSVQSYAQLPKFVIEASGNVGIGTTAPTRKLHVNGDLQLSLVSYGVTPGTTQLLSLATVEYVNGKMSDGYLPLTGGTLTGNLNMGGNDISNVNKLTVVTVDPLYRIGGINYSSFAPSVVGGVKEEIIGRVKVDNLVKVGEYEKVIDFSKVKEGSDLWVWRKTVDFSRDNVEVLMTPYGGFADTYYKIEGEKIILRANKPITISYRLIGHRIDWKKWPTKAIDQHETPGFVID